MLSEGVPTPLGCRELTSHAGFMGSTHPVFRAPEWSNTPLDAHESLRAPTSRARLALVYRAAGALSKGDRSCGRKIWLCPARARHEIFWHVWGALAQNWGGKHPKSGYVGIPTGRGESIPLVRDALRGCATSTWVSWTQPPRGIYGFNSSSISSSRVILYVPWCAQKPASAHQPCTAGSSIPRMPENSWDKKKIMG